MSLLHQILSSKKIKSTMDKSIKALKVADWDKRPFAMYRICQGNDLRLSDPIISNKDEIDMKDIPSCPNGYQSIGIFYPQEYSNSTTNKTVISRSVLKEIYGKKISERVICAGNGQWHMYPDKHIMIMKPQVFCVMPKQDVTTKQLQNAIQKLDSVYDMASGLHTAPYMRIMKEVFETKTIYTSLPRPPK